MKIINMNKGIILVICITFYIQNSVSIKCWDCRSDVDSYCEDPFNNETFPIVDCKFLPSRNWQGYQVDFDTCLKIIQSINGSTVTIRRCAYFNVTGNFPGQQNTCVKEGANNITLSTAEYCSCNDKDGCNSASYLGISLYLNIFTLFTTLNYFINV